MSFRILVGLKILVVAANLGNNNTYPAGWWRVVAICPLPAAPTRSREALSSKIQTVGAKVNTLPLPNVKPKTPITLNEHAISRWQSMSNG